MLIDSVSRGCAENFLRSLFYVQNEELSVLFSKGNCGKELDKPLFSR
jgi:hypothetical protein